MNCGSLSDESLLRYDESIRDQLATDLRSGNYHFLGAVAKSRANDLLAEIQRRKLTAAPILWPN